MTEYIQIGSSKIGPGRPIYVIAEISANHHQDFNCAAELIHAAKACGANAVKLQTYTPDTLTIDCDNSFFQIGPETIWAGQTLYDLYGKAFTPWEWHPKLQKIANELDLDLFSSPFDDTAVDFLENLDMPAYKIASFELPDHGLLRKVAANGKPIILSTGMASLEEIKEAVEVLNDSGCQQLAILKCTSAYPATPEEMNLRTITDLKKAFKIPIGLSDHSMGLVAPITAIALGACIIEKHLTLSRATPGPDSTFSLEPKEFKAMVLAVRATEKAIGETSYVISEKEKASRTFRRSLFITEDVRKGQVLTHINVRSIRPGYGLSPKYLDRIIGQRAVKDLRRGTPLKWDLVET